MWTTTDGNAKVATCEPAEHMLLDLLGIEVQLGSIEGHWVGLSSSMQHEFGS